MSASTLDGTVPGMVTADVKRRENRLRLAAQRRGLLLRKSRRRDPLALDYGWELREESSGRLLVGNPRRGYGASLDEIERYLSPG